MGNLTLLGRNGGKCGYRLRRSLAAAVWTSYAALFDFGEMENLGELFIAILTKKNVLGHNQLPPLIASPAT